MDNEGEKKMQTISNQRCSLVPAHDLLAEQELVADATVKGTEKVRSLFEQSPRPDLLCFAFVREPHLCEVNIGHALRRKQFALLLQQALHLLRHELEALLGPLEVLDHRLYSS